MMFVAPNSSALSSLFWKRSTTVMLVAPLLLQAINVIRPMHPAPRIHIDCPGCTCARFAAWTPTASGSIIAPCTVSIVSGSLNANAAGWLTYFCKALLWNGGAAIKSTSGHRLYFPLRQYSHFPQGTPGSNATVSPFFSIFTFLPASTITPAHSCPSTIGRVTSNTPPTVGSSKNITSEPQIPTCLISINTSQTGILLSLNSIFFGSTRYAVWFFILYLLNSFVSPWFHLTYCLILVKLNLNHFILSVIVIIR